MSIAGTASTWPLPQGSTLSPWLVSPWWPADPMSAKQRTLLRMLSAAVSEQISPAPLVFCLAQEHRGKYRRRLRQLAQRLASGMSLPDALENTPGVLPDEQILAIRFGTQSGILSQVLEELVAREQTTSYSLKAQMIEFAYYGKFVVTAIFLIILFLMTSVMPSFRAIFSDFQLELPPITHRLIDLCDFFAEYWYLFALALIAVYFLTISHSSRKVFRRVLFPRFIPPVASLRVAELLELLSMNASAGRPLAGALSTLARYHTDPKIRHKLLFVFNEVQQGAEPWERMVHTRLVTAKEAAAIETATSQDSRAWTMLRLAQLRRDRFAAKVDAFGKLLQAAAVLCLGAIVLFVGVALLFPLFDLSSALSG